MNVDDMHPLRRIQIALNQCEINNHFENNYMMQCHHLIISTPIIVLNQLNGVLPTHL